MLRTVDRMSAGSMGVPLDYLDELLGFHSRASRWASAMDSGVISSFSPSLLQSAQPVEPRDAWMVIQLAMGRELAKTTPQHLSPLPLPL